MSLATIGAELMETGRIISHIESAHARSPPDDFTQQENGTIRNSTTDSFFFFYQNGHALTFTK